MGTLEIGLSTAYKLNTVTLFYIKSKSKSITTSKIYTNK